MPPRLLIIETSGQGGSVALADGPIPRGQRHLDEARRHVRDLAPAVAELFAGEDWKPRDVEAIIVSRGPGSYTGLRVGIMSAKAFAYATGCRVIAVDTFAAIAAQAPAAEPLDVIADAQQGKIYVQRFLCPEAAPAPTAVMPLTIQDFADWLAARELPARVSGPGLAKFRHGLPVDASIVPAEHWDPRPESLLRLGLSRFLAGNFDEHWTLEPLYLRPSSAEEKWQAMGK